MQLNTITVKNYLAFPGQRRFEFEPGMNVITGPNGQGKSSLCESVGYTIFGGRGRVGDLRRRKLFLNKTAAEEEGFVAVALDGTEMRRDIPGNDVYNVHHEVANSLALEIALGYRAYTELTKDERIQLLYSVSADKLTFAELVNALKASIPNEGITNKLHHFLSIGIPQTINNAKDELKGLKLLFQALTGEKWNKDFQWEGTDEDPDSIRAQMALFSPVTEPCPECGVCLRRSKELSIPLAVSDGPTSDDINVEELRDLERRLEVALHQSVIEEKVAQLQLDFAHWTLAIDLLSPNGLFQQPLQTAITAINQLAAPAYLGEDHDIYLGDRPFRLLASSEKWLANAHIQEAIARLSHNRIVIFDGFDALQLENRRKTLGWLYKLRAHYDSLIISGPIPAQGLPGDIHVIEL